MGMIPVEDHPGGNVHEAEGEVGEGGGRLVERFVWRVFLERSAWNKTSNTDTSEKGDISFGMVPTGVEPFFMSAASSSSSSSLSAMGKGGSSSTTWAGQQDEVVVGAYHQAYGEAVEGCARLAANVTWVCPNAAGRLPGLLPRFPVDAALSAATEVLSAFSHQLSATRALLKAGRASFTAAKSLTDASRAGRALGAAALRQASLKLSAANATAAKLQEHDLEAAKHRAWSLERAAFDLTEGKNREFYDKPCRPVFGACCARDSADGGMSIICG